MTLFVAIAAAMTAAALLFLLPPLLRRRTTAPDTRVAANAAIYREQLDELAAELQRGAIARDEFERASREIERRVVAEHAAGAPAAAAYRPPVRVALALGLLLPLAVAIGYWHSGNPEALREASVAGDEHSMTPEQVTVLVERLAARLRQTPEDAEGWLLLGRSLAALGQYERSAQAYEKASRLLPRDANVLADYADALAMAQDRRVEGEPMALVQRALALDPDHVKALALAGSAEFERKDYAAAIRYWERIQKIAPPESEFAKLIAGGIAEARERSGMPPVAAAAKTDPEKTMKAHDTAVTGTVTLDPALAAQASPGDTVFILARPVSGPRMPLAVARTTVAQLPYRFTLDDSMAMAPGRTISGQAQVLIVARVSKAGSATPQKGDIEGSSPAVAPGAAGLRVVLSRVIE